jgi:hypothetical protein
MRSYRWGLVCLDLLEYGHSDGKLPHFHSASEKVDLIVQRPRLRLDLFQIHRCQQHLSSLEIDEFAQPVCRIHPALFETKHPKRPVNICAHGPALKLFTRESLPQSFRRSSLQQTLDSRLLPTTPKE